MTLEEALQIRVGWHVSTPTDDDQRTGLPTPRRVTAVWVNEDRTLVRIRIAKLYGMTWISPEAWKRCWL